MEWTTHVMIRLAFGTTMMIAVVLADVEAIAEQNTTKTEPIQLQCKDIKESSGLAVSWRHPQILWTHNDSGDSARLFAFDLQGKHKHEVEVKDVENEDWESMASYQIDGKSHLLVGDVGDNALRRKSIKIYRLNEPNLKEKKIKVDQTWKVKYPDGPHNCEALAVDLEERKIILVSKVKGFVAQAFSVPLDFKDKGTCEATAIGAASVPMVTGMDIHPVDGRIILVTYADAFLYSRKRDPQTGQTDWKATFAQTPRLIPLPLRRQGESICFDPAENAVWLTSEKKASPLLRVVLP